MVPASLITNRSAVDDLANALAGNVLPQTEAGSVLRDIWLESGAEFLPTMGGYPADKTLFNMVLFDMLETTKVMLADRDYTNPSYVWEEAAKYLSDTTDLRVFRGVYKNISAFGGMAICLCGVVLDWDKGTPSLFPGQNAVAYHREFTSANAGGATLAGLQAKRRLQVYTGFWEVKHLPLITEGPEV